MGWYWLIFNTLRPRLNGRHFADDTFKCIFLNKNVWIPIEISLTFVPKGPINNIPALVQIMAWRRPGDTPLFEPMMVNLPTHICISRPQWVNSLSPGRARFDFINVIFNLVLPICIIRSSYDNALRWTLQDLTADKFILVQVMAWCHQATSHYLSQCWHRPMSPIGITRPHTMSYPYLSRLLHWLLIINPPVAPFSNMD